LSLLITTAVIIRSVFNLAWLRHVKHICIQRHIVGNVFIQRLPTFFIHVTVLRF